MAAPSKAVISTLGLQRVIGAGLVVFGCAAAAWGDGDLLTGTEFTRKLREPVSVDLDAAEIRPALARFSENRRLAIVLDRRFDPSLEVRLQADQQPPLQILNQVLATQGGAACVLGDAVYLGPRAAVARARTLVALRNDELTAGESKLPDRRRFELARRVAWSWDDLETPRDILERIAETYRLEVDGIEQLPHDLWAAARIPKSGVAEILALVLLQFDLSFEWTPTPGGEPAGGIRIGPLPERLSLRREYAPPPELSAAAAAAAWRERFPELVITVDGKRLLVDGRLEDHEELVASQKPAPATAVQTAAQPAPGGDPLRRNRFTLKLREAPLRALFNTLSRNRDTQLQFEYAEDFPAEALDFRVSLDVREATIDTLLHAALRETDLAFERTGRTVRVSLRTSRRE